MEENTITLKEWLDTNPDMDMKRNLYLYGDMALNYLNDRGVIVDSFDINDISLVDGDIKKIRFDYLSESDNYALAKDNLYQYAKSGIKMYMNYFDQLNDDFLKNNYNEFEYCLPKDDVNYFKGVIQRGSFVYFNEFDFELRKKKLKELGAEVEDSIDINSFSKPNNDEINRLVYGTSSEDIVGGSKVKVRTRDAAFVEFMYYPVMVSLILGVILLITYCFFGL